jgi:flagellar biosynthesis/type III secretory pathway protein FliH
MTPPPPEPAKAPRAPRIVRNPPAGRVQPLYPATRLLKGAVLDAEQIALQARQLREAAQAEAKSIRQAAHDEADAVRKEAFEHGAREAATEFTVLLQKLDAEIERLKKRFAVDVQRVAFRFAKAILDVEFVANPDRVVQLVSQVIKPARLYHRVKIHLHPDDVERVRADQQRLAKQLAFAREIQFAADAELPRHGVRVETEMGSYVGTVDSQIKKLQEHLLPGAAPLGEEG